MKVGIRVAGFENVRAGVAFNGGIYLFSNLATGKEESSDFLEAGVLLDPLKDVESGFAIEAEVEQNYAGQFFSGELI